MNSEPALANPHTQLINGYKSIIKNSPEKSPKTSKKFVIEKCNHKGKVSSTRNAYLNKNPSTKSTFVTAGEEMELPGAYEFIKWVIRGKSQYAKT